MTNPLFNEYWKDYEWLVVVGALISFFMAWGIGANDVANAFGTSVGAKTLTLKQACLIAAVFEFAGAVGLGGEVTKTIAGSIARPASFVNDPELFAFGMMCALAAASSWVYVATYLSLAVSTTHSIIGAVLGFALVWQGSDSVVWNDHIDAFPYSKGLVPVVCSWFVSPISSCIVASFFFISTRTLILRRENSTNLAIYSFPLLVVVTVFINIFFVFYKGCKNVLHWDPNKSAWVAAIVSAALFVISAVGGIPYLRWRLRKDLDALNNPRVEGKDGDKDKDVEADEPEGSLGKFMYRLKRVATRGLEKDIHHDVSHSQQIQDMHAAAEVFKPETEQVFKYLQVFSACAVSFSHGANDVANAIGPFAAIWFVYRNYYVSSSADTPTWILAMGGAGIVIGLATYGYNIMASLGVGMAKMTPSRGFCAELATSFVVVLASVYGLPVSSTQTIVGAELGIGLCENIKTGANWQLFGKTVLGWIFTIFVAGLFSAAFFSAGGFAPSVQMSRDIGKYELQLRSITEGLWKELNVTNYALNKTFADRPFDAYLNTTAVTKLKSKIPGYFNTKKTGYIKPMWLVDELNAAIKAYKNYTILTVGFNKSTVQTVGDNATLLGNVRRVDAYSAVALKSK